MLEREREREREFCCCCNEYYYRKENKKKIKVLKHYSYFVFQTHTLHIAQSV